MHATPMYSHAMDVGITALRADLATWIGRARQGEEIVVTERGIPVARLIGVDSTTLLEDLTRRGVLNPPASTTRRRARDVRRVRASGPVSDLVSEQRR
jgi:prevent-host-death family protein